MGHNRSQSSNNLPFSWEAKLESFKEKPKIWTAEKPRISWGHKPWEKTRAPLDNMLKERIPRVALERDFLVLPPPPASRFDTGRRSVQIPLGFTKLSPPKKSCHQVRTEDDPFLAAYIEVTKSVKPPKESTRGGILGFSCKRSCAVVDTRMVRVPARQARERLLQKET